MGGGALWGIGLACIAVAGALYFGVYPPLNEMAQAQVGPAAGLVPVGLGILGCALCGLGFIQKSDV
ncbi:Uncharacterised protein [uncultured archaeon]|nr:Uncharacterised protein [uncultured archaeon]